MVLCGRSDAEDGKHAQVSLALLEEAKLWTAILLRLARKLALWKVQAPRLAQFMVEQIPVLVATLTEALMQWKGREGKDDWVSQNESECTCG